MKRREFLKYTAAASAAGAAASQAQYFGGVPVYAKSPGRNILGSNFFNNDNILIIIQLFGGNDGLNTIVPLTDDNYHNLRPNIHVNDAEEDLSRFRIAGSESWFHPNLVESFNDGFLRLHDEGRLAVIQGVGYEHPNLSHFRATDIWLSGFNPRDEDIFNDPQVRLLDGWLGRYFSTSIPDFPSNLPDHPISMQIGGQLSLMLQSDAGDTGIAITNPEEFFELGGDLTPDDTMLPGIDDYEREYNYILQVAQASDRYKDVVKTAFDSGTNTVNYPDKGLARQMGMVAKMISGGLETKVFLLRMGGFDNHVNQVANGDMRGGLHPALLKELSTGISMFMADAVAQGFAEKVIGMTVTEFGRRPRENGSRGTDHGTSSVQFVFGEKVRAGLYGENPDLTEVVRNDGRGNPGFQNEYRRVYAEMLEVLFGASEEEVEQILGKRFVHLGLLEPDITSVHNPLVPDALGEMMTIYPNPSRGAGQIAFELDAPAKIDLSLYRVTGEHVLTLHRGLAGIGKHVQSFTVATAGSYLCMLKVGGRQFIKNLTIIR